jgi:serine/threonine protein kinase
MFEKSKLIRRARKYLKEGYFCMAGKIFEEIGNYKRAINVYVEGECYNEMGELYEKLNQETQAIELYKKSGNVDKLIQLYLKRQHIEAVGVLLEDNNRFQEAAELYYSNGRFEKAAQIYARKGYYRKAALIYEKGGNLKRAAENFERWFLKNADTTMGFTNTGKLDKDLFKAVDLYVKVDEIERAYNLLLKTEKFEKAGDLAVRIGKYEEAVKLFELAKLPSKAAVIYEKIGKIKTACQLRGEDALIRGQPVEAAGWFLKGEDYFRAAELYELEKQFEKAAYCYFMNQGFLSSAENYIKAGNEEEAAKMFELGHEWEKAADINVKLRNYQKAGDLYEKIGYHYNAGICFEKIDDDNRALANFKGVKSSSADYTKTITQMANIYLKNKKPQLVIEEIGRRLEYLPINRYNLDCYYVFGQAHEIVGNFKRAFEIYQRILVEDYSFKDVSKKVKELENLLKRDMVLQFLKAETNHRYRIIDTIGEGGMGIVFKAMDTRLSNRIVALKLLSSSLIKSRLSLDKFLNEARSTASLSHPNIVTVYDVCEMENCYFIAMEFIEGKSLIDLIRRQIKFNLSQIFFAAMEMLKALYYSHQKGIIHRDIKPHNIMVNLQGEIKIMDFGIALLNDEMKRGETGMLIGTPDYMSPEQIQGIKVDYRTDIYSFGVTLFQLIAGRLPFKGEDIFYQHLHESVPDLKEFRVDVPVELIDIVEKCMEKKREDRYQSVQEIFAEIKKVSANFPVTPIELSEIEKNEKSLANKKEEKIVDTEKETVRRDKETMKEKKQTLSEDERGLSITAKPIDREQGTLTRDKETVDRDKPTLSGSDNTLDGDGKGISGLINLLNKDEGTLKRSDDTLSRDKQTADGDGKTLG